MKTNELEQLLEAAVESPGLDFKASIPWDVHGLVKDFLAMANTEDGGVLVIGVSEESSPASGFRRDGVSSTIAATYDPDIMKDQVAAFADPFVEFAVSFVLDSKGLNYVVIRVLPFLEQPVICKKEGKDVHSGEIYYRKPHARPQSCRIDSAYDMRNMLLVAHARMRA
jgi:predicted HTH transcriptional regulator